MQPYFLHDCQSCVFLGNHTTSNGDFDLYFCGQAGFCDTVIARYSDEGSKYMSGINSITPELIEAQKRAKEKGILFKSIA